MNMNRQHGFTLLELLITIGIVGVTMAFAIPGMTQFVKNERLTSTSNTLLTDIMLARSKAVERNQPVFICASSDETSCTGGNFEDGWIVIIDIDNDGLGDQLVKVQQPITANITFNQAGLSTITFDGRGFLPTGSNTGTISVCDDRTNPNNFAKTISISPTGRASRGASPSCP